MITFNDAQRRPFEKIVGKGEISSLALAWHISKKPMEGINNSKKINKQ